MRSKSVESSDWNYTKDAFFFNLLAPYTHELNFNIKILAGASDLESTIWKNQGYLQNAFEIGGKGTLRGYDWKEFASSHYFLSTLEIWFDEFGILYDRAALFESPGNTFNAEFFSDFSDNISANIFHSAGISFGDEDASLSFIRKLNGDQTTIMYLTLTFGAPLQYW